MKLFKIEENDANQRLDKFLKKLFPNATRSLIYKLNRKEKVKVKPSPLTPLLSEGEGNKFKKRDNEYKLQVGDEVKIFLSDDEFNSLISPSALTRGKGSGDRGTDKQGGIKENIVFEDADLLVLNKNP
ncbi:MAG: hypothetical protein LBF15_07100 [Candidatus Peribacteria bacterium]|jgi:23S rRNA-/tRNA-specific pseudouridylate synthase|nr:hypothetical protein [Candidatus Peribacteria bacterium]